MLKKILIALAAIIAVLLIVVALQPSEFHVERTATITAPPATVFDQAPPKVTQADSMGNIRVLEQIRQQIGLAF